MGLFNKKYKIRQEEFKIQLDAIKSRIENGNFEDLKMLDTSGIDGALLADAQKVNAQIYLITHNGQELPKHNIQIMKGTSIKCPYCKSSNIQFMQQTKKNFSLGKAVSGTFLAGELGALAGFTGKKGNLQWLCQDCNIIFETKG